MKILLIIIMIICVIIIYLIYKKIQHISYKRLKNGDVVWYENNDNAMIPCKIIKVDVDKNGKTICIYLNNNESYTFDELKKSKYML